MQKLQFSPFLSGMESFLRETVVLLEKEFDFASILGTDSKGLVFSTQMKQTSVGKSNWGERGFVVRVQKEGHIAEHSCSLIKGSNPQEAALNLIAELKPLLKGSIAFSKIQEEADTKEFFGEIEINPFDADPEEVLKKLKSYQDQILAGAKEIVSARTIAEFVHISKMYVSTKKKYKQTFMSSQAYYSVVVVSGENQKDNYDSFSGLKGLELLDEIPKEIPAFVAETIALLSAEKIIPGEYEVVCTSSISGLIAHEAFGHGVEMDMFVKNRAKAQEYINKRVGSDLVTMYDDSQDKIQTGTFLFDDEGNLGHNNLVIDKGILVQGLSDSISAFALHTKPTGNGRRESFKRKAYARMTNTYFAPGTSTKEEIIASVKYGYLLEKYNSGMEDPKNWGIQLVVTVGREIKDGKLTGKMVSPIICSGYVPDVLNAISMVSKDFELSGSGYCGKGYKEFVKTSTGGPYLKTKMRLG